MGVIKCPEHGLSHMVHVTKKLSNKLKNDQIVDRIISNKVHIEDDLCFYYYSDGIEFPAMDKIMNEDLPETFPYCCHCFKSVYDAQ